jgi:simple sugar transport system permease protein
VKFFWITVFEGLTLPMISVLCGLLLFGLFANLGGYHALEVWSLLFKGAFGDAFSFQNSLQRAAPLTLTALCVAIPAQAGLVVIGGEGALVIGGLACALLPVLVALPGGATGSLLILMASALAGGLWIAMVGYLRQYKGVNETISSLLLGYIAINLFKFIVEDVMRDPSSLNKPSTKPLEPSLQIGTILNFDIHWGLVWGVALCLLAFVWLNLTTSGFAVRMVGGNSKAARLVGLPVRRLSIMACALGGACAGLAGGIQVAAVHTAANASLIEGLGYTGILVSFVARHQPLAILPVALLLGGFAAAGSMLQRHLGMPDASVQVLLGLVMVITLASDAARGRFANRLEWKPIGLKAPLKA